MRNTTLVRVIVLSFIMFAANSMWAAEDDEAAKFKEIYAEYQNKFSQADYLKALPLAQEALSLGGSIYGIDSKSYAALHYNYGINLLRLRRGNKALESLQETLRLYKELYGKKGGELIALYMDLAEAKRRDDYQSNWTKYQSDALGVARSVYGKDSADYALLLIDAGHLAIVNQIWNGEKQIRNGYKILLAQDTEHPRTGYANFVMGKVQMARGHYADAIPYLQNSLEKVNDSESAPDPSLLMTTHAFMTEALVKTGNDDAANKHLIEIGLIKESLSDNTIEPIFTIKPEFPRSVRRMNTGTNINVKKSNEGFVHLSFDVDENGYTVNHQLVSNSGPQSYIDATIEAVKKFRYAPKFINGEAAKIKGQEYVIKFLLPN